MTFLHWLGKQFDSGVNSLSRLWDRVHSAIAVVWHSLASLGHVVGAAWGRFHDAIDHLGAAVADLARQSYTQVRRLLTITIPNGLRWTLAEAFKASSRIVADLRSWTRSALAAASRWTARIVADLRSWTANSVRWLTGHIASLRSDLNALKHAARYILAGPDAAAGWLFGALTRALVRWLRTSAEALTRYLVGHAVSMLMRNLTTVEHIIADIF